MDLRQAMKEWVRKFRLASLPQGTAPALSEQTGPKSPTTPVGRWAARNRDVMTPTTAASSPSDPPMQEAGPAGQDSLSLIPETGCSCSLCESIRALRVRPVTST